MGLELLFSGLIFFTGSNILMRRILNRLFSKSLSSADQYLITEKCISSLQAILSTVAGIIIIEACQNDIMYDIHWLTNTYAWFGLPYFVYDIWAMYNTYYYLNNSMPMLTRCERLKHFTYSNIPMLFHHLCLPCVFFPMILYFRENKGDYFVGVLYTCESAIPFISIRFILAQLKMKDSIIYIVSGLMMIFVFFIVRICIFPFLYWKYGVYDSIPFLHVPFRIPIKCNMGCLVILLVQFYFLYLMVRGAFRVFYKIYQKRGNSSLIKNN
ncbi:Family with sequence similarity 57 [Mactra antiquata]